MQDKNNNFWIVYADLMAGLLFIFILLISAVLLKYIFLQSELLNEQKSVNESKELLLNKDELLNKLNQELAKLNQELDLQLKNNNKNTQLILDLESNISDKENTIKNLNILNDEKDIRIVKLLEQLNELNINLVDKNKNILALEEVVQNYKNDYLSLKNNKQRLINALREKLSKDILINLNSGSIILSSNILFDSSSYTLKESAKASLKNTLNDYLNAILSSSEILNNIDNIVIEGHTDSDGEYLYNLELSQKRALEIMKFIRQINPDKRLEKLLVAVGKSFSEPIYKNNIEDKAASRRIEIKLSFSNEAALKEFEEKLQSNF